VGWGAPKIFGNWKEFCTYISSNGGIMRHSQLAQIAFLFYYFYVRTGGAITDTSFGNELAQFQRYVSIADKRSVINASVLYETYRACEEAFTIQEAFTIHDLNTCQETIRMQQLARLPLWKPTRNPDARKRYLRDCEYVISTSSNASYSFQISQSACKSGFSLLLGGSTFEITASSSEVLALCRVHDNFDNSYNVRCEVPYRRGRNSNECLNVTVKLETEHFDAYSDIGDDAYAPLDVTLSHDNICITAWSDESVPSMNRYWFHTKRSFPAHHSGVAPTIDRLPPSKNYQWGSATPKYYTKSSMDQCFAKSNIVIAGESHIRYQFDVIKYMYVDRKKASMKHTYMAVPGMEFRHVLFSIRMAHLLDEITCTSELKLTTFVLQTGSWDLSFFAPRGLIDSPYQGHAVVMAMKRLWARIKDKCEDHVRIVWMSTMPHPLCEFEGRKCPYSRNNAAINAANEQLRRGLSEIGMKHFTYVDTGRVLLPRFPWKEFVAIDHYLYFGLPDGMLTTPGGMVLLHQVLFAVCDFIVDIEAEADSNNASHNHRNATYCIEGARYRSTSGIHYLIENGWKRAIPDHDTGKYMGAPFYTFSTVEDSILENIPSYYEEWQYPSRKTYQLLQYRGDSSVYFMDGGKRRPLSGVDALDSLGMGVDNVTAISELDMLAIPIGEMLNSRADCLHCTSLTA
jgi:hypothetical protein